VLTIQGVEIPSKAWCNVLLVAEKRSISFQIARISFRKITLWDKRPITIAVQSDACCTQQLEIGMPISVACECGQGFQAKDALAGKTVKCPKCGNPLQIPSPSSNPLGNSDPLGLGDLGSTGADPLGGGALPGSPAPDFPQSSMPMSGAAGFGQQSAPWAGQPQAQTKKKKGGIPRVWLFGGIGAGVVVVLAIVGIVIAMSLGGSEDESPTTAANNDSAKPDGATGKASENSPVKQGGTAVTNTLTGKDTTAAKHNPAVSADAIIGKWTVTHEWDETKYVDFQTKHRGRSASGIKAGLQAMRDLEKIHEVEKVTYEFRSDNTFTMSGHSVKDGQWHVRKESSEGIALDLKYLKETTGRLVEEIPEGFDKWKRELFVFSNKDECKVYKLGIRLVDSGERAEVTEPGVNKVVDKDWLVDDPPKPYEWKLFRRSEE
jgi:nitrogen fixation protein FixH